MERSGRSAYPPDVIIHAAVIYRALQARARPLADEKLPVADGPWWVGAPGTRCASTTSPDVG